MGEHADHIRHIVSDGLAPVRRDGARTVRDEKLSPRASLRPEPIPPEVQTALAPRFHYDFSRVRVHADERAADAASSLRARAFTVGSSVFFGAGEYDPSTSRGRHLLAHELAHVIQADPARAHPAAHSNDVPALEYEARSAASAFAAGKPIPPVQGVARGLSTPLRAEPGDEPALEERPTFGNLPQDKPLPGFSYRRVELFEKDGIWYQRGRYGVSKARGSYDFVVKDGNIFGVKGGARGYGHTELAGGGRVEFAGQVEFEGGICREWSNASGHYGPVRYFKDVAVKAGLPEDKFVPIEGLRPPEGGPQLPVFQPETGHLHPASKPGGPTGPKSPAPDVQPPAPDVQPPAPDVQPPAPGMTPTPVEELPVSFTAAVLEGAVNLAIGIVVGLIIQWGLSELIQAALEADVTAALKEQLPQKLDKLRPKLDALRAKGNVFIWISYNYYYQRSTDPIFAIQNPPFYEFGSVSNVGVHAGNEEISPVPWHHEYPEPMLPERERVKAEVGFRVRLDDLLSKT